MRVVSRQRGLALPDVVTAPDLAADTLPAHDPPAMVEATVATTAQPAVDAPDHSAGSDHAHDLTPPVPAPRLLPSVTPNASALPLGRQPALPLYRASTAGPTPTAASAGSATPPLSSAPTTIARQSEPEASPAQWTEAATPTPDIAPLVNHPPTVSEPSSIATVRSRGGVGQPVAAVPARVQRARLGAPDDLTTAPAAGQSAHASPDSAPPLFSGVEPTAVDVGTVESNAVDFRAAATDVPAFHSGPPAVGGDPSATHTDGLVATHVSHVPVLRAVHRSVSPAPSVAPSSPQPVLREALRAPLVGNQPLTVMRPGAGAGGSDGLPAEAAGAVPAGTQSTPVPTVGGEELPPHLAALVSEPTVLSGAPSAGAPGSPPSFASPVALPVLRRVPDRTYPAGAAHDARPGADASPTRVLPTTVQRAHAVAMPVQFDSVDAPVAASVPLAPLSPPPALSPFATPAAEAALASGLAAPTGSGEIVFAPPGGLVPSLGGSAVSPPSFGSPMVQRSVDGPAPVPAVQTEPLAVSTAPATGGGDLDHLAEQLYDRFKPLLTRDLLQERERSSLLLDL